MLKEGRNCKESEIQREVSAKNENTMVRMPKFEIAWEVCNHEI